MEKHARILKIMITYSRGQKSDLKHSWKHSIQVWRPKHLAKIWLKIMINQSHACTAPHYGSFLVCIFGKPGNEASDIEDSSEYVLKTWTIIFLIPGRNPSYFALIFAALKLSILTPNIINSVMIFSESAYVRFEPSLFFFKCLLNFSCQPTLVKLEVAR